MPLPLRPVQGLNDPNQQRRDRETLNDILTFRHDDSRIRTPAEVSAGVTPVNYAYPVYQARRYGAKLDGSTDDTAAFGQAILAAYTAGGGTVTFDGPTNVLNIALRDRVSIVGIGNPSMQIMPASSTDVAISAIGTVGASVALSANARKGAYSVSVASSTGLAIGQKVLIRDQTFVFSTSGQNQEINYIADISGGTITLLNGLIGSYTTASSASIDVLNSISDFVLSGFQIEIASGSNGGGLALQYCTDFAIRELDIRAPASWPGIRLTTCAFGRLQSNQIRGGQGITGGGSSGLSIDLNDTDHDILIDSNILEWYNQVEIAMRSRYIQFTHNICRHAQSAVNTHGDNCAHILIADNHISDTIDTGISVGYSAARTHDEFVTVRGNTVVNSGFHGISVVSTSGDHNLSITVENNEIRGVKLTAAGSTDGIFAQYTEDLQILNNRLDLTSIVGDAAAGISVNSCPRARVAGNRIREVSNGYGIQLDQCSDYTIESNFLDDVSSYNIITTNSTENNYARNNQSDDSTVSIESSVWEAGNTWNQGTFTATLTGVTGTVTGTWRFQRTGWQVMLDNDGGLTGTSNTSTTVTVTGLPAILYPAHTQRIYAQSVSDNGVAKLGRVTVETVGVLTYATDFAGAAFSGAGTTTVGRSTFAFGMN